MKSVSVTQVLAWHPCPSYTEERVRTLFNRRKRLTVEQIAALDIPITDRLWAILHEDLICARDLRLFACDCAERALKRERKSGREPDPRSWAAVEVARRYARGEATEEEQSNAHAAAAAANAAYADANAAANAADAYAAERKWQLRRVVKYAKGET